MDSAMLASSAISYSLNGRDAGLPTSLSLCVAASPSSRYIAVWTTSALHVLRAPEMSSVAFLPLTAPASASGGFATAFWCGGGTANPSTTMQGDNINDNKNTSRLALACATHVLVIELSGGCAGSGSDTNDDDVGVCELEAFSDDEEDDLGTGVVACSVKRQSGGFSRAPSRAPSRVPSRVPSPPSPSLLRVLATLTADADALFSAATDAGGAAIILGREDGRVVGATWDANIAFEADARALCVWCGYDSVTTAADILPLPLPLPLIPRALAAAPAPRNGVYGDSVVALVLVALSDGSVSTFFLEGCRFSETESQNEEMSRNVHVSRRLRPSPGPAAPLVVGSGSGSGGGALASFMSNKINNSTISAALLVGARGGARALLGCVGGTVSVFFAPPPPPPPPASSSSSPSASPSTTTTTHTPLWNCALTYAASATKNSPSPVEAIIFAPSGGVTARFLDGSVVTHAICLHASPAPTALIVHALPADFGAGIGIGVGIGVGAESEEIEDNSKHPDPNTVEGK